MRDKTSCAINTCFRTIAVSGVLLLPNAAFGASAHEAPSAGGAFVADFVVPHAVADIAASLGCALSETAVAAQDPGDGQEPKCKNLDGSERECTPSEDFRQCLNDAGDAAQQCVNGVGTSFGRRLCGAALAADIWACEMDLLAELLWPWT